MFRVSRTTLRGQYADDRCFLDWLAKFPTERARIVSWVDDPSNDGGPNDRRFYLWWHDIPMNPPIACPGVPGPDLMNDGKTNGWAKGEDAIALIKRLTGQALDIKSQAEAANVAARGEAMSLPAIAKDLARDVEGVARDVAQSETFGLIGKVALGALAFLGVAWWLKR